MDDERVHLEAYRDVLRSFSIDLSERDYWDRYLGFDDAGAFRAILEDAGRKPTDDEVAALVLAKRPHYMARAEGTLRGFPGAAELVQRLARTGPVFIVSGALRDEIELGLEHLGVSGAVSGIVSAEDTRRSKPDPEGYLLGIDALAARVGRPAAGQALVVEDSVSGVEAAKAARLPCVAVLHTYPEEPLRRAGADRIVPDLLALTDDVLADLGRGSLPT